MSKTAKSFKDISRFLLIGLCICLLLADTLILAPEVGAASDTQKTEPIMTMTEDTSTAEDDVLAYRANTVDEAKKEALAAVNEQLAAIASDEEESAQETQTPTSGVEETTATEASSDSSATSSSNSSAENTTSSVQASAGYGYLMGIDNPDPYYVSYAVQLSDVDRDNAERIVMGEAGSTGFTGMALVAQTLRDTYVNGNYSSIADVIYSNGYYGSMSITPSATCKEVINFIFDQGGAAVQHNLRVFYASNYCSSPWHEAQKYVCSYGYVRFFDM